MATVEVAYSSLKVESTVRSDYWREITRPIFDIGLPNHDEVIEGELYSRSNGELLIGRTRFTAQSFMRSPQKIQATGLEGYVLQVILKGSMYGVVGNSSVQVRHGDIYIFDLGRVCENHASAGTRLTMMIERGRLERLVGRTDLHGVVFRREQSINRLLTDFLTELWNVSLELSYADSVMAVDVVGRLVRGGLGSCAPLISQEQEIYVAVLRSNILRFIEAHLESPELGVGLILRRFQISRATLYRVFKSDRGVALIIREKRLNAARDLVSRSDGLQISQIAYSYGFSSQSQFFKAFRRQFGISPSDAVSLEPSSRIAPNIDELVSHFLEVTHSS